MKFLKFSSVFVLFVLLLWYGGEFLSFEIEATSKFILYLIFLGVFISLTWMGKVKFDKGNFYQIFLFLTIVFSIYLLVVGILLFNNSCLTNSDYINYENQPEDPYIPREPLLTPPPFLCPFSPIGWANL